MNMIIVGSGRVGAAIASALTSSGHHISMLDRDPDH